MQRYKERTREFRSLQNIYYTTYFEKYSSVEDENKTLVFLRMVLMNMIGLNQYWISDHYCKKFDINRTRTILKDNLEYCALIHKQEHKLVDSKVFLQLLNIYELARSGQMKKENMERFNGIFNLFMHLFSNMVLKY